MSQHSDKELEEQISEAGNKLLQPPSSLDELLPLLDQVESSLSKVEQSPAKSMHDALSPLMKALVANDLLRHSDLDVKVAVASCISEITRITAPDAPYDDDKMKDIFQLIVSSFENINDQSSRSFNKRVLILETVAKVRSCVVMLDLECDRLITEMFQHFLKAIREDHSENIFSSMATIMTLVLEESEEISLELLTPLLASVKKDNEEVAPIAKRLGETVFANCATKLRPYLPQAVESLQISLNEYNKIVTSVLEGTLPTVDGINDSAPKDQLVTESKLAELLEAGQATQVGGGKVATASSDEAGQMAESAREEACSEDIDPAVNRSPKSITSNGVGLENVGSAAETQSLMKAGDNDGADLHGASKIPSKSESDDSRVEKSTKSEPKSEQTANKKGRKTNSSINSAESSHQAPDDSEKEAEKLQDHQNDRDKDDQSSASEDPAVEQSKSLEKEPETTLQHSAPKESEVEAVNVATSSPGPDESAPKKVGRAKEDSLNQEECVSKEEESEATSDLEVKQERRPLKKTPLEPCRKEKSGSTGDAETKKQKQSGKKIDTKNKSRVGQSARNKEDGKKRGHGKASVEIVPSQESPDHSAKHDDDVNEEEIPRATAKRKRSSSGKGRERVPPPVSPDNSAKHESDEEETPMASAKRKRSSSGKGRESVPTAVSPDNSAKHESDEEETPLTSAKRKRSSVKERVPKPESPDNSAKHESDEEETPMTSAKSKRSSGKDRVTETTRYDENLVGKKIKVLWPLDDVYYEGIVSKFDSAKKKFTVHYIDGEVEVLNLEKERWELVGDDNMSEEEQVAGVDAASDRHKKKKLRNAEPSAKHKKMEASSKSKSKETTKKSGQKSKGKLNMKDGTSKSGGRTDDTPGSKSGVHPKRSTGKSVDTEKPSARSKDVSSGTPKSKSRQDTPSTSASKSKQETVKAVMKSKSNTSQSGGKASANGKEKLKSSSSKVKESGHLKEKAINSAKTPDSSKEKFSSASKERENESKSGKKRGRGKN
ncbi:sister chromatid cohesion protein PDS5 homolog C isoform X2 [Lycium barbarum]|uniref:sister chromatid cohesion protein PDS5 homolog C isoform X2 n=1 Tax=Lycium barbarum TaxID=112863 RepID=UPI00293F02A3|nr:sister chromatid cohesion protein PDS5 homolog C isoform X2 [Lycium barbarum]